MLESSVGEELEAAVAAGNSAAVLSLFRQQQEHFREERERTCRELEKKHAVELWGKEAEFLNLAENSTDGIIRLNNEFRIIYANPSAAAMMGSTPHDLLGKTPLEFPMPMHIVFMWQAGCERVFASGENESFEYEFDDLRTVHYLQIGMSPEFDSGGRVESVLAVTRDISEQKKAVLALRESEDRFRLALGSVPLIVYSQDGNLRYVWLYSSITKLPAEKFLNKTDHDIFPAEAASRITGAKRKIFETGRPVHEELTMPAANEKIWLDISINPLRNTEGQIIGITGVVLDITERKKVEAELREVNEKLQIHHEELEVQNEELKVQNEELLLTRKELEKSHQRIVDLYEYAPVGYFSLDKEGVIRKVNLTGAIMLGKDRKSLVNHPFFLSVARGSRPSFSQHLHTLVNRQVELTTNIQFQRADGSTFWGRMRSTPITREDETAIVRSVVLDISEQISIEEALRKSESKLRALFSAMDDVILVLDSRGQYLEIAPTSPNRLYKPAPKLVGKTVSEVFPPEQADFFLQNIQKTLASKQPVTTEYRLDIGENEFRFSATLFPLSEDSIVWVARDITERTHAEERIAMLRREQELYLRHEVKNLLAPMQFFSETLLHDTENLTEEQIHSLRRIQEIVKRTTVFIDSLKRIQDIEYGTYALKRIDYSLNAIIGQSISYVQPKADTSGVTIRFHALGKDFSLPLDYDLIPGVFTNLILNAVEHVEGLDDPSEKVVNVDLSKEQDRYIIRINNKGTPVPPERLATFFEKYTVGPEKKGGSGMGTAYARLVTKAHGGDITVTSNPEEGTTVTVILPIP